jgi:hypothetical protein
MQKAQEEFIKSAQEDPLFAAEGLDLAAARSALTELEQSVSELEEAFSGGSFLRRLFFIRYPLARYAMPVPFLRALVKCEGARRVFLAAPTKETGDDLLGAWRDAAQSYERSVARYRALHLLLSRMERDTLAKPVEDIVGNQFTFQDVLASIDLLAQNAAALTKEAESRASLLHGTPMRGTAPSAPPVRELPRCPERGLDDMFARVVPHERRRIARRGEVVEVHGPLCYRLPHFDGKETEHQFFVYIIKNRKSERKELQVVLADELFFLDLQNKDSFAHWARQTYEPLPSMGVPYWYQSGTNFYSVRDQRYWADLATIVDCARRPELNQALLKSQRSSLLDMILYMCSTDLRWYSTIMRKRARSGILKGYAVLNFGLIMRSNPSLLFLPFNRSVWRLPEQPNFLGTKFDGTRSPYKRAREVLPALSDEALTLVMDGGYIRSQAWKKEEADLEDKSTEDSRSV